MERYLTQMGKKREEELGRVMGQSLDLIVR
jgi:hypothetical protein